MWKRTKPYECEICGERGSTRVCITPLNSCFGGSSSPTEFHNFPLHVPVAILLPRNNTIAQRKKNKDTLLETAGCMVYRGQCFDARSIPVRKVSCPCTLIFLSGTFSLLYFHTHLSVTSYQCTSASPYF